MRVPLTSFLLQGATKPEAENPTDSSVISACADSRAVSPSEEPRAGPSPASGGVAWSPGDGTGGAPGEMP